MVSAMYMQVSKRQPQMRQGDDFFLTLNGSVTGGASLGLASSTLGSGGMLESALLSQSGGVAPGAILIWVALMFAWAPFSCTGLSLM